MPKHILAIHAHPDDLEILAGGTLVHLSEKGYRITVVTMTPGDKGSDRHSADEIAAIRRREAANAAAHVRAEYRCAEFPDLEVFSDNKSRKHVTEILRWFRADLILTASPVDYLCDHEETSRLVRDACFTAALPNYATGASEPAPVLPRIPVLYFVDPLGAIDRDEVVVKPDFIVNVESTFERKRAMLAEHKSQREWLQRHHGIDNYMITMEEWTSARGGHAGVLFGEGFRRYKGHPYSQTPTLEELLGPELILSPDKFRI